MKMHLMCSSATRKLGMEDFEDATEPSRSKEAQEVGARRCIGGPETSSISEISTALSRTMHMEWKRSARESLS